MCDGECAMGNVKWETPSARNLLIPINQAGGPLRPNHTKQPWNVSWLTVAAAAHLNYQYG
jgi:hypothetical protein